MNTFNTLWCYFVQFSTNYLPVILLSVPCSLVQLQEEKERQFTENRAAFEEMVRSKDHEIHSLQGKVTTLTKDLDNKNKVGENICTCIYIVQYVMYVCKASDL